MAREPFDPNQFFEAFPRFIDTSETGPWLERLNARYLALIHANRDVIAGSRVLDLASHDGRFSFAALQNGASHVTGIEWDPALVSASREHMEAYGVPTDRFDVVLGDIYDFALPDAVDVVFCFGILYHINHHVLLLTKIATLEPRFLIIDSKISQMDGAVIELRSPLLGAPPRRNCTRRAPEPGGSRSDAVVLRLGVRVLRLARFGTDGFAAHAGLPSRTTSEPGGPV
jgi:2-polyprenyl-3-methyl-5-hydroxy-6-metoxy-1,4-benzoquinol methylase